MPTRKKSVPTTTPPSAPPQPEMVVLTTRLTAEERDLVRQAAGWGGVQRFVRDAVMLAVEKARQKTK